MLVIEFVVFIGMPKTDYYLNERYDHVRYQSGCQTRLEYMLIRTGVCVMFHCQFWYYAKYLAGQRMKY